MSQRSALFVKRKAFELEPPCKAYEEDDEGHAKVREGALVDVVRGARGGGVVVPGGGGVGGLEGGRDGT